MFRIYKSRYVDSYACGLRSSIFLEAKWVAKARMNVAKFEIRSFENSPIFQNG